MMKRAFSLFLVFAMMVGGAGILPANAEFTITLSLENAETTVPTGDTPNTILAPNVEVSGEDADRSGISFGLYEDENGETPYNKTGVTVDADTGEISVEKSASTALEHGKNICYLIAKKDTVSSNHVMVTIIKDANEVTLVTVDPTEGTATLEAEGGAEDLPAVVRAYDQYGNDMTANCNIGPYDDLPAGVNWAEDKFFFNEEARASDGPITVTFFAVELRYFSLDESTTVNADGPTATFELTIKKGPQGMPANLSVVEPSAPNEADGKITGVTAAMEYKLSTAAEYTACEGTEITGLGEGKYLIRYAETDYLDASEPAVVILSRLPMAEIGVKPTASQTAKALDVKNLLILPATVNFGDLTVQANVYKRDAEGAYALYEEEKLAAGEYVVDVKYDADMNEKVQWAGREFKGPPSSELEADLSGYVKLTVRRPSVPGIASYMVTYRAGEHGTLQGAATETVTHGDKPRQVPVVVAKSGYQFRGWSLDGKSLVDPKTVTITEAVTFTALYSVAEGAAYINGYADGRFLPQANIKRCEVATMLAKLSRDFDKDEVFTVPNRDIVSGSWYEAYMKYAVRSGLMSGYEDGNYRPENYITRGEFAKMLAGYLKLELNADAGFSDVTGWAAAYANALKRAGITQGYEDGTFRQENRLTREEAVAMINRAVKLTYQPGEFYTKSFSDVRSGDWSYGDIMAAANTPIDQIIR